VNISAAVADRLTFDVEVRTLIGGQLAVDLLLIGRRARAGNRAAGHDLERLERHTAGLEFPVHRRASTMRCNGRVVTYQVLEALRVGEGERSSDGQVDTRTARPVRIQRVQPHVTKPERQCRNGQRHLCVPSAFSGDP
jgi:hypothetical protein